MGLPYFRNMRSKRNIKKSHQKEKAADPLITTNWGPIFGATITAAGSLLIYSLAQVNHIDERLDRLEQEARILLDGAGGVRPSEEALKSFFALEHLKERVERLEGESRPSP